MSTPISVRVETTATSETTRWVINPPALAGAPSGLRTVPADSPLGLLVESGHLESVVVQAGDVYLRRTGSTDWPELAQIVQAALVAELTLLESDASHWLYYAAPLDEAQASIDDIQRIVDRSAGAIMAAHGGSLTVVEVAGETVTLKADGACHGCGGSDQTLLDVIRPAVVAQYPQLTTVRLAAAQPDRQRSVVLGRVKPRWFASRSNGTSCH